jgi:pimeloyl-ACP methyl ester carboxylesterase
MARWAARPTGTAVVFVHGFGGRSMDTWREFDERLPELPGARGADLLFFGYDGVRTPALSSSIVLRDALDDLMSNAAQFMNSTVPPELHRPPSFRYQRPVVVAHSFGAVIARKALLDCHKKKAAWLRNSQIALFAPAHRGAPLLPLVRETLGLFAVAKPLFAVLAAYSALRDLDPQSAFLTDLRQHTERAIDKEEGTALSARFIGISKDDRVVEFLEFVYADCPATDLRGSHTAVCKPSEDYLAPIEEVGKLL